MENVAQENEKAISGAIKIDEKEIRSHLDGLVRQSVEDTLNALLNAEADAICQASRSQRSPDMKEIRRRTRVVGSFPDGYSAMMLVGARLRHIFTTQWGTRQYMNACKLYEGDVR